MDVEKIRKRIPALEKCTHLNSAAVSPLFSNTIKEIQGFLENRGRKADFNFSEWLDELKACKRNIGELVNASEEEIALTHNTSEGINTVAQMIPWKEGDTVVTSDLEFPSNSIPWYNLRKKGVRVKTVHNVDGEIRIEDIEQAMDQNTKLVALSYVQFGNGFRTDLEKVSKLCREHNAFFFSDVIQGMGAAKFDVRRIDIDFFSGAAYKWLMGPLGVGIFYIKKELIKEFDPPFIGWHSLKKEVDHEEAGLDRVELAETAQRFEAGGRSFALIKGLKNSLEILLDIGLDAIERRVLDLSKYVIDNAKNARTPRDERKRAGIVNIAHSNPEKAVEKLKDKNIFVSPRMGGIRVATHFWNTEEDIDKLLDSIQ
ncbi:MAG: aminotransferase class V-fold PLP-dependent enzyme [Euryarchaeota archaeon]|nr:aminotransferase class V-fold PLP-dependent enzyme [Euryarchaeota archaeon]